jgi:hypothetical protein
MHTSSKGWPDLRAMRRSLPDSVSLKMIERAVMTKPHFAPEPDAEHERPWEPRQEEAMEAREHRQGQAEAIDHGRHGEDRSRPITVVRKNR